MKSFLTHIKNHFGDGSYEGDEFGGAAGHDGSGLPTGAPGNFMFATGIECSYPTIANGTIRRDCWPKPTTTTATKKTSAS